MLFKLPCFFQLLQSFRQLKLTLKIFTTKTMWFYCKGTTPPPALKITTCKGAILEQVTAYEYLSIWLETSIFFFSPSTYQSFNLRRRPSFVSFTETVLPSPLLTLIQIMKNRERYLLFQSLQLYLEVF